MKVGDYVRTKHWGIFKILKIINQRGKMWFLKEPGHQVFISSKEYPIEEEVIKSSPNIIDLIEIGDYVNGKLVVIVNDTSKCKGSFYQPNVQCRQNEAYDYEQIFDDEIKSIVTHEQFSQMEYKIGE